MPGFRDAAVSGAPPEEVWKLLYDPARFPEWWAGIARVEVGEPGAGGPEGFSYYTEGEPATPVPQGLTTSREDRRVVVSCLVHGVRFEWVLEEAGDGTRISVIVDVPDAEAERVDVLREGIGRSVARLAALADAGGRPAVQGA